MPLQQYFPEYTGGSDVNKAAKYILWRFTQLNRAKLSIYPQSVSLFCVCDEADEMHSLTQATDTSNIRLVFAAVKGELVFCVRWSQLMRESRNDPSECIARFWHTVIWTVKVYTVGLGFYLRVIE